MSEYSFGDIITLDFPYSHHRSGKKRPAMIVTQDGEGDMVVARITSKVKTLATDVPIRDWSASGLNVPSYLRLSKIINDRGRRHFEPYWKALGIRPGTSYRSKHSLRNVTPLILDLH